MIRKRPAMRVLDVARKDYLTPNMIRVTLSGEDLIGFPEDKNGGNIKLFLPEEGQSLDAFRALMASGKKPVTRTYTARRYNAQKNELDVDFVVHDGGGPACEWAMKADKGSFIGLAGPSGSKLTSLDADHYIVCADMSAMPAAEAYLEALPEDAKGDIYFEVTSAEDQREIFYPSRMKLNWLIHSDPHAESTAQMDAVKAALWPDGKVAAFVAGETSVIRDFRPYLTKEKALDKGDVYISGYWKIGLVEDQHQIEKRKDN